MIKNLRVALKNETVSFIAVQPINKVRQNLFVTDTGQILRQLIGKLKGIHIPQNNDMCLGIAGQKGIHDFVDRQRLRLTLILPPLLEGLWPTKDRVRAKAAMRSGC